MFAAWPSAASTDASKDKPGASAKSGSTADKSSSASNVADNITNDSANEGFEVVTKKVTESELGKWLKAAGSPVALAVSGHWSSGTGLIEAIAFVNSSGGSVWCTPTDGGDELSKWLASSAEKIVHDAKGPMLALNEMGTPLNSLIFDTAIASYLVSPGGRNFELADLVMRYLGKSLDANSSESSAQLTLDASLEVSGDVLAKAARATLDLSEFLKIEKKLYICTVFMKQKIGYFVMVYIFY